MLEGLAAWVLKYYLGKYVENLNTDQLSIGLLQGQVELENLPLKKEALRQAGLPIQIKAGFIGKVKLQIPIRQIRTAPWVILIEKLYLVAGPVNLDEWDEEAEAQALQEQKLNALDAIEAQWRATLESQEQGYYASSYSSWLNFGTSIVTNIVENLQLNIVDVHFRYEDEICIPDQCFTFGLSIDSLVAQSCNENWEPGFDSGPVGFKVVELLRFSIYWDDCSLSEMLGGKEGSDFMECMGKITYRGRQLVLKHVSGVAHIKKDRSAEPLKSKTTPRIICDISFDEFPIVINDKQYAQLILWMKGVSVINTRIRNHRFRPQCSIFECSRLWWKYAYLAVLHKIRPHRYSRDLLLKRIKDNVIYVNIFKKILNGTPRAAILTPTELTEKQRIEYEQTFEELRVLRELCLKFIKPASAACPPVQPPRVVCGGKKNFLVSWFPQWWYSTSLPPECTPANRNSLDEEILDVFTYPNDTTYLKRDVVFGQFNFSLKQGSIKICAAIFEHKKLYFKSLMELQFEKVLVGFEYRPRSGSYKTTLALGSIYIKDRLTKETVFPMLVSPQSREGISNAEPKRSLTQNLSRLLSHAITAPGKPQDETLFQLSYEYKPFNSNADYRLLVKTQSLDVVYNPEAINWLTEFFTKPLHQSSDANLRAAARQKYQALKTATKNELIKNWEKILAGDLSNRKTWEIDLDISAPQIIFVEHFCDKNAVIVVIDFGHLHFSNCVHKNQILFNKKESDDDEAFQTPCSTPPGSWASPNTFESLSAKRSSLSELSLHHKLYDRYELELSDMQVLVGKIRDNWKYAHLKGTSTLHVLDRFNISLQVERRIVQTYDPQFPSLTFFGNLPRLVVHVNEQKISAIRAMIAMISDQGLPSPFRSDFALVENDFETKIQTSWNENTLDDHFNEMSQLIIMQFTIHHLALEVQSRSRSVAELQVSGVKAASTIRPYDTSVTLSVHSLLLVDALQTFGRDFELLVASHKHVVMDSLSGSLRDSEPTSPIPSGSPEPTDNPVSPVTFNQLVNVLHPRGIYTGPNPPQFTPRVVSPNLPMFTASLPVLGSVSPAIPDTEALISVELNFVSGSCPGLGGQPLQFAAIQFNNLDIIANQETIVELLGFAKRVFPASKTLPPHRTPIEKPIEISKSETLSNLSSVDDALLADQIPIKAEITFDFHRLNVLLLRAVQKDGALVGRKICTATMMQAKIKAIIGEDLIVEGSLGGIQIVDLTPEGMKHQRILSLGADPLTNDTISDLSAGLYSLSHFSSDKSAFSFSVKKSLQQNTRDGIDVKIRLASVWYTHSPLLVKELQSCATEFKQYLSNLAKSIKSAATEMAMGFVHARAEALAQSLSVSGRLSASLYGGSTPDISSPKRRRKSFTQSVETLGNTPYTPYSPVEDGMLDSINVYLDVVLDTPVIILPMSPNSDQVFVAHLGKITAKNSYSEVDDYWSSKLEKYNIEIRDMNLYSVTANVTNVMPSLTCEAVLPRPDKIYPSSDGKAILHNTIIEIKTERKITTSMIRSWDLELDSNDEADQIQIYGCVVGPLKVSLTREQYQQLLETLNNLVIKIPKYAETEIFTQSKKLGDIQEEETESMFEVPTLTLDPTLRARTLNMDSSSPQLKYSTSQNFFLKATFDLPEFTIELLGELGCLLENGLVSISFRDFVLTYDQTNKFVNHLQMRLKSLVMEDLLVDKNSKNRYLVVSSAAPEHRATRTSFSQSCPNLANFQNVVVMHNSLPDKLYEPMIYCDSKASKITSQAKTLEMRSLKSDYPSTPPPSPRHRSSEIDISLREENLVFINVAMIKKDAPNYNTQYGGMDNLITIDFNCLDVIANIESWVVVFDFFDIDKNSSKKNQFEESKSKNYTSDEALKKIEINSKLDLEVCSLTLVLIRPEYEVAKANISHLSINTKNSETHFSWEGRLGSMSILDLTPHGKFYRERFLTSGNQALHVKYTSYRNHEANRLTRHCDSELYIEMSSIFYVHTSRFLGEIYEYFDRFSQFQALMVTMRSAGNENKKLQPSSRMLVEINAGSPVLLLPISSASSEVLVVDLGKLTVRNSFRRAGSDEAITSPPPEGTTTVSCLLDVMSLHLVNMDLYAGTRHTESSSKLEKKFLKFGSLIVIRQGPSLLPDKCHLKLQIDRNLDTHLSREVPDISIKGTLEKLEASLDLSQYKLIRGILSYNIGENLQDLYHTSQTNELFGNIPNQQNTSEPVWLMNSIHLDLVNVVVDLKQKHGEKESLACINFIKSRLIVESFSDCSQDIDLVSAEILITDTRFRDEPAEKRCNVFTNILQPLNLKTDSKRVKDFKYLDKCVNDEEKVDVDDGTVQAEIHYRRRKNYSKATILLHNMRVMAVLDWWERIRDFIVNNAEIYFDISSFDTAGYNEAISLKSGTYSGTTGVVTKCPPNSDSETIPYEFKLNITDSEIVLAEDTSVWDSNAIILKSTTVISYRPELLEKPLSCNLNHCEVFSCILGMEEETALSIIDPVTINMEVTLRTNLLEARGISDAFYTSADRALEIQMQHLCVRLSYHDFRMLSQMMESIPKQTHKARSKANEQDNSPAHIKSQIFKLSALGFCDEDCIKALEICRGQLDEAAIWLTQNATHDPNHKGISSDSRSSISFETVEIKLSCLSICIIDDCRDADVPLLELSMSQFSLKQEIEGAGVAKFLFTSDYYNRVLSGWEPFIEPWRCSARWEHSLTSGLLRNRLQIQIQSEELLNINITSTLLDLYRMVKDNWTQDYCSTHTNEIDETQKLAKSNICLRRRSPFVPFALKNETGSMLWFTVLVKTNENLSDVVVLEQDNSWIKVLPKETVPFTFGGRGKVRHRDTHIVRVHQIAVRVDMWKPVAPVSVDKVGVYFRQAVPLSDSQYDLPPIRLVFEITLEGSARKLVTVRSGLTIKNLLQEAVEAKLENTIACPEVWDPTTCLQVPPGCSISAPITHSLAHIWIRPLNSQNLNRYHAFSNAPLDWTKVKTPGDVVQEMHQCHSNRDRSYRFVASIHRENFPEYLMSPWPQPGHTIILNSPLTMINLLPCLLNYSVKDANVRGHITPGSSAAIHEVDCNHKFEIHFHIENFPKNGVLLIQSPLASSTCRVKLHDESGRRLDLFAGIQVTKGIEIKISIWAPYWIINKTSLPLVFKQEGTSSETAGQFRENEIARIVTPLLFSLSDPDASPTVQARVGALYHPDKNPQWCQHFHLQMGAQIRQLRVSQRDHRPDIVYSIGINIRPGKGLYRNTNIVTLSPRFQLHNKSSYKLQFAQKCLATTLNDPGASATYASAVKDCSLAWHWPRLDKKLLLCIRLTEVKNCLWSGGFAIDNEDSFHINIRDKNGKMHFLRVEIVLQAATYFAVFTDADTMPPPIKINNFSQVGIHFFQTGINTESLRSMARPQTSVDYAWDEPLGATSLTLIAPGGASASYDINSAIEESTISLTYENFIYIAFTATFKRIDINCSDSSFDPLDVESQQLVLDCVDEYRVILNRKQHGARSQLWRMTSEGQLQHEGSSPPRDPRSKTSDYSDKTLVLDIAGTAPQPSQCVALVLRRLDKRRASTQKWRFTEDGRLCCAHKNMCVQAKDGFFGLRQGSSNTGIWQKWSEAVLGPTQEITANLYSNGVPIEQAVSRMKMRPGSGCLSVSVMSDGPTRVLKIIDPIDGKRSIPRTLQYSEKEEADWSFLTCSSIPSTDSSNRDLKEIQLTVDLKSGFGISVVSRKPPEELLFLHLKGILLDTIKTPTQRTFDCTIQDIQCDNQLFEPQCPVVLYVTRGLREDEPKKHLPAVQISAHKQTCNKSNAHIFKHLIITVKNLSLRIEERLLLKLYIMFGNSSKIEKEGTEESDLDIQKMVMEATSVHATRYYFGILKLEPSTIRLSVVTSAKLPPPLLALKRKLQLTLIKFEDATVELEPFIKRHPFETAQCLINSILKHFKQELKWQAAVILGSVDFLGSPLGLMNDVSEGFSDLFAEGNIGALFKNVAHGLSNSTAKVTGSLSDGLGRVILDDNHEETRQKIRKLNSGSSSEHIIAGLKGLGLGIYGGMTSVFKQTYEGAANEGFQGLISGFGKGLVGTVTKPMVGILDLATETASAVRDSSRSTLRSAPPRFRLPRCIVGSGGLLPHFSSRQSQGQEFLYIINERNYSELMLSYEILRSESEDLRIIISSESIRVFTIAGLVVVLEVQLSNLYHSQPLSMGENHTGQVLHYIEMTMRADGLSGQDTIKRPRVRCDTQEIASSVSDKINYSKSLFEERSQTLISSQDISDD